MSLEGYQLGHYRLQRLIGSGGMGEIYQAQDTHVPRLVAVKVLRTEKDFSSDSYASREAERLFEREMKAISSLDHPHILPIFDYGTQRIDNITPVYLVMPYRPEGSLRDWLRQQEKTPQLDPYKVMHILRQAADALQHAHERRIIHQDVKPANFLIRARNGATDMPDILLADFGIAKFIDAASSASQSVRGTPTYMAPEQWEGRPVPASDQYSLAIMIFLLLTGITPFQGSPGQVMFQHLRAAPPAPGTINPRLSPAVDAVLLRALLKQPQERFPSILQFSQALQQEFQSHEFQPTSFAQPDVHDVHRQQPQATVPTGQLMTPISSPGVLQQDSGSLSHLQPASSSVPPTQSTPSLSSRQHTPLSVAAPAALPLGTQVSFQQAQHTRPVQRRLVLSRSQKLLLIALIALVALGSSGIAIFSVFDKSGGSNTQAVATVSTTKNHAQVTTAAGSDTQAVATVSTIKNHAQVTTAAQTTVIVQANMIATTQASKDVTATAIANDPYINGNGTLLISDSLNGPENWLTSTSGDWGGTCTYKNGAYHAFQGVIARAYSCNTISTLQGSNSIFEVQATIISGDCGGILFRYNPSTHFGYTFRFCHDGNVSLVGQHGILYGAVSSAVRVGYNQSNIVAAVASGNQIRLYINKQYIITVIDDAFSQGRFALDVRANTQPTEIAFNNAKIWQL